MFLIIDNTEDGKVVFYFSLDNKFAQRTFKTKDNRDVLVFLGKLLSGLKLSLEDIKYLGVVVGAGRFTSSRLAVTTVNTLAFSLKIPVVALPKNFDQTTALKSVKSAVAGKYVVPTYSGEARIG
jgi:tRNA A37 threonylcarbamoyladenosine modification protein TsaB